MDSNLPGQWESCLPPTTLGLWFPEQSSQISTAQVPSLSFYCSANTSCLVFYFGQSFLPAFQDLILMFPGRSGVQGLPSVPRPQVVPLSQRVLLESKSMSPDLPLVEEKRGALLAEHQISLTVSWMSSELTNAQHLLYLQPALSV